MVDRLGARDDAVPRRLARAVADRPLWAGRQRGLLAAALVLRQGAALHLRLHLAARHAAAAALRPVHGARLEAADPGLAGLDRRGRRRSARSTLEGGIDRSYAAHRRSASSRCSSWSRCSSSASGDGREERGRRRGATRRRSTPFAGGFPVPPLPGQVADREPATGRRRPSSERRSRRRRRGDADPEGTVLGPGRRVRRHLPDDVQEGRHRAVPVEKKPTAPRFHGRHQLNRWPDGLEKCIGCELCAWACPADAIYVEGARQHRGRAVLARGALRPRLPDQLPALHPLRAVHRGLPDPRADDDQRVRAGRRQPRRPDLREAGPARPAAARHGAAAAPDAARRRRGATTTAGASRRPVPEQRPGRPARGAA